MLGTKIVKLIAISNISRKLVFLASKSVNYSLIDPYKIKRAVYSFAAGPAPLPYPVMLNVKSQFLDYKGNYLTFCSNLKGTGEGVIEMSHRSDEFSAIIYRAKSFLTKLLDVPQDYRILFTQGGATF